MDCFVATNRINAMSRPVIDLIVVRGSSIVLQTALALGMGWLCNPADFGEFVTVVAYAMVSTTVCSGGAYQAALRVSHLLASDSAWHGAMTKYLLRTVMRRALFGAALTAITLSTNKYVAWSNVAIGALLTMTASFASIATGITMARGASMRYQVSELAIRIPVQILCVAGFIFMDRATGLTLVLCTVISSSCSAVYLLTRLPIGGTPSREVPPRMGRLVDRFMTSASINASLFSLFSSCDILIGSRILSSSDIAPLGIANRVSSALAMINSAIFDLQSSKIAMAVRQQRHQEVNRLMRLVAMESVTVTVFTAILLTAVCITAYSKLPVTYLAAMLPMAILLAGRLIQSAIGPKSAVMTLSGHHTPLAWIVGAATAVEVALIYSLAPAIGTPGLAIASTAGLVTYSVVVSLCMKRISRINVLTNQ
jgi:O-antigen/teichoic acid export membrane protein